MRVDDTSPQTELDDVRIADSVAQDRFSVVEERPMKTREEIKIRRKRAYCTAFCIFFVMFVLALELTCATPEGRDAWTKGLTVVGAGAVSYAVMRIVAWLDGMPEE